MSVTIRERKRTSGKTTLYLDIYSGGQRRFENLGIHLTGDKLHDKEKRRMADAVRAQREMEQHGHRYGLVPEHKRKADLASFMEAQMQRRKDQGTTFEQLNNPRSAVRMVRQYARGTVEIGLIDSNWLTGFQTFLLKRVKPSTAARYFAVMRAALNRAVKEGIITVNPCSRVDKIKVEESERAFLTFEEVQRLAEAPCDYDEVKRAFIVSAYTGLRLSDIEALKWSQVADGYLHVVQKKTGTVVRVPLNETALRFLGDPQAPDTPVFALPSRTVLRYNLKKWARSAGIAKHVSFHTARHTFATIALTAGVDVYTVSKLLGHRNVNTTQIYAKVVDSRKREAVDMLPGLAHV